MFHNIKVIVGCTLGDEGKGLATDYFASKYTSGCIVVLSNGGSQRGHTVSLPIGTSHVFRHFGSGLFCGADTYLPKYYIVNPMNYYMEREELRMQNVPNINSVYINPDCPLTTPFDMIANQLIENARGDQRHGSCGVGIWETILRNGITVGEMHRKSYNKKVQYLEFVRDEYFRNRLNSKGVKPDKQWESIINNKDLIHHYIYDFEYMINTTNFADDRILNSYPNIIFENGQGLLLDQNIIGYGKHTTPSNTGLKNPAEMIKKLDEARVEVCYVTRTYLTRHGAGRLDDETQRKNISPGIRLDTTNRPQQFQGVLRYAPINWKEAEQRAVDDFNKYSKDGWKMSFFITHINEHNGVPDYICNNYENYYSYWKSRDCVFEGRGL